MPNLLRVHRWSIVVLVSLAAAVAQAWEQGGDQVPADSAAAETAPLPLEFRQRKVLENLPTKPDLLINLDPEELPATSDMVKLGKPATPAIINGLVNSMSSEVRSTCAAVLAATRDPRALDSLIDALDDPEEGVVASALNALGRVESRKATPRMLALLKQQRVPAYLKDTAMENLGQLGDPAAIQPLLAIFLKTWDPAAQQALWAMRRHLSRADLTALVIRPLEAPPTQPPPDRVLRFAIERAGELKLGLAVRPMIKRFETEGGLQNRIVYNLGLIGDRAAVPFLQGLLDRTAEARLMNNVCFALQRLGQDVGPFLKTALTDRRAYIRFNAAFVAGDIRQQSLAPDLVVALKDANDFVRSEVAVALGKLRVPATIPALEEASREWNPVVRRDALLALARLDYAKYRERVIEELLRSRLSTVRGRALQFLAEQDDRAVVGPVLAAIQPLDYGAVNQGLGMLGRFERLDDPQATAFLLRVAGGQLQPHQALVLLARFVDERTRFVLRQWLEAPRGEQDQLLRALARYRDRESLPAARRWLSSRDPTSQLYAAFFLASLGEKEGGDRLLAAIEEAPEELKRVAALLLTELDLKQVAGLEEGLVQRLEHPDVYVRLYAAQALLEKGDPRAIRRCQLELDRRIPFIDATVLDMLDHTPRTLRRSILEQWSASADPLLRLDLEPRLKDLQPKQ